MRWVAMVAAVALSGCSFVFVRPPPPHEELRELDCTESRAAPILDVLFTVLQGTNLVFSLTSSDAGWADAFGGDPPFSRRAAVPLYALLTTVGAFGARYGFHNTDLCREQYAKIRENNPGQPDEDATHCREERHRILVEANKIEDKYDRMRMISSAPRCPP